MTTANSYKKSGSTSYTPNQNDVFADRKKDQKYKVIYGDFFYTRVGKPITQLNTKDGLIDVDPFFSVTMGLTDNSAKYLRDAGFEVMDPTKDIPKPHIKFRRNVKGPDTSVDVYDAKGQQMNKDILIGNGSKGQALVFVYDKQNGAKTGAVMGIQVTNLVAYNPEGGSKKEETKSETPDRRTRGRKPVNYGQSHGNLEEELDDEIPF